MGASGYVSKSSAREEIMEAIETILNGGKYVCEEVRNIFCWQESPTSDTPAGLHSLTPRELEIITLVSKGNSSNEIAGMIEYNGENGGSSPLQRVKKTEIKKYCGAFENALPQWILITNQCPPMTTISYIHWNRNSPVSFLKTNGHLLTAAVAFFYLLGQETTIHRECFSCYITGSITA